MTTPSAEAMEKAKGIIERYSGNTFHHASAAHTWLESAIAQALEDYREVAVGEVGRRLRGQCYTKVAEKDLRKARAETLEEAAKRCELWIGVLGTIDETDVAMKFMAKEIRALKDKRGEHV